MRKITEIFDVPEVLYSSSALSSLKMLYVCLYYNYIQKLHISFKMRPYVFVGLSLWHFPTRECFIFVFIFSFRKGVKIALTYLEKVGSGKECIPVRHVLVLQRPKFETTEIQRFLFSMMKCQTDLYKCSALSL